MSDDDTTRVMWPFPPNWDSTYSVSYVFKTDIFTSEDGSEQRRALRSTPRKTLQFTSLVAFDRLRTFNRIVDTAQNLPIIMPEVTRSVVTTTPISGATASVSANPAWLIVGAEVIINDRTAGYKLAVVTAIDGTTVTFDQAPPSGAGTRVYPALTGQLADKITAKRITNSIAQVQVEFNVDPASEKYTPTTAPLLYGDTEIARLDPNWASGVSASHEWEVETVDFGRGRVTTYRPIDFPRTVRGYDILATSADPIVDLFMRMKGQRGRFLISTMEPDLVPLSGMLGGATIDVAGTDAYYGYREDPVRSAIEIHAPGIGTWLTFVSGMALINFDQGTRLTLVDPLPDIAVDLVARISWVTLSRFASDTLQAVFTSTEAVRTAVNVQTLPSDEALFSETLRSTVDGALRQTVPGDYRAVIYP